MSKIININSNINKNKLQSKTKDNILRGRKQMSTINVKPIMATPQLSGQDVQDIVTSVMKKPNKTLVERNRRLSSKFKNR